MYAGKNMGIMTTLKKNLLQKAPVSHLTGQRLEPLDGRDARRRQRLTHLRKPNGVAGARTGRPGLQPSRPGLVPGRAPR